jgi:hypothetical protein
MLDWLGRMIGLPKEFLPFTEGGSGGGVIQVVVYFLCKLSSHMQGSASECVLVALLAARAESLKQMKQKFPFVEEGVLLSRLIAYCSKEV